MKRKTCGWMAKTRMCATALAAAILLLLPVQAATRPADAVDVTSPDPARVTTTSTGSWLVGPTTAFHDYGADKNTSHRVIKNATSCNIIYSFDEPTHVDAYGLVNFQNGCDNRTPGAWTLYGSNTFDPQTKDESAGVWTSLVSVSGEKNWTGSEYRYYTFENDRKYTHYKFDFTGTSGAGDYIQFAYLEMFSVNPPIDPTAPDCTIPTAEVRDNGEATITVSVTKGEGDVYVYYNGDFEHKKHLGTIDPAADYPQLFTDTMRVGSGVRMPFGVYAINPETGVSVRKDGVPFSKPLLTSDYARKMTFSVSPAIASALGESKLTDFPVLVRLSSATVADFSPADFQADGMDLLILDDADQPLSFEVDSFDPAGETLVWVKVPAFTAETTFTLYYDGPVNVANDPKDVWSGYLGVWHMNERSGTGAANATANANLDGNAGEGKELAPLADAATPFGSPALAASAGFKVKNWESVYKVGNKFSVSGWFKLPTYAGGSGVYATFITAKTGLNWNANSGWYLQMNQSKREVGLVDSAGGEAKYTSCPDVTANWNYFHYVNDGSAEKVYFNGATTPQITRTGTVNPMTVDFTILGAKQQGDEFRISKSTWSALRTSMEYKTMAATGFFTNSGSTVTDASAPVFEAPVVSVAPGGIVSFSVSVRSGAGEVFVDVDGARTSLGTIDPAAAYPQTFCTTFTLAADQCAQVAACGVSPTGNEILKAVSGGVIASAPVLEVTTSPNEKALQPGAFTISRPAGVSTVLPLKVRLQWSGTGDYPAQPGVDYIDELPTVVRIPAGEMSVTITVRPLVNLALDHDTYLRLTVEPGAYVAGGTETMTLLNLVTDPNYNTWIAQEPGLASADANWSKGVPQEGDAILFEGGYSTANCTWDAAAPHHLVSWTQAADYTGSVTIETTHPEASQSFTTLEIDGDVLLAGGRIQPKSHGTRTTTQYWLNLAVGGDMTIAAGVVVDAIGRGRYSSQTWGGSAAHGGDNGTKTEPYNSGDPAYGSILDPHSVAHGSQSGTDSDSKKSNGGGTVVFTVAGDFTNHGIIDANGSNSYAGSGAGGTINVRAKNIYGADGEYRASSLKPGKTDGTGAIGSGGRIALVAEGVNEASLAKISCRGNVEGWGRRGAAGTIYLKGSERNEIRVLYGETENWNMCEATTPIPAQGDADDWTKCAKTIDLVGDQSAHLRLTKPLVKMNTLSLLTANRKNGNTTYYRQSDLDLAGKILQVKAVLIDGVDLKLAPGDYTLAQAKEQGWTWLKDSSYKAAIEDDPETQEVDESVAEVPGSGILRIKKGFFVVVVR